MTNITIDPWADFTKEQLITVIKQLEVRLAGMAERARNLEKEAQRQRKEYSDMLQRVDWPNRYAHDGEKLFKWLFDLQEAIRPVLGVSNKKWGIHDYLYAKKVDDDLKKMAQIIREFLDYYDIDDE